MDVASGAAPILPSWDHLRDHYVAVGLPALFVVSTRPHISLFLDPGARRLGIRIEGVAANEISIRAAAIECVNVLGDGARTLELSVATPMLFRAFYLLTADLAPRLLAGDETPAGAVARTLSEWRALLREDGVMSEERQQGLFGELWLLARLLEAGENGLAAWTGPSSAAHDFRLNGRDVEVKTTRSRKRTHVINGLAQLQPAPAIPLFLLSLRLDDAGEGGRSLPEAVSAIARALGDDQRSEFLSKVERSGYRAEDAFRYVRRWRLADAARVIPVDDGCPRLTRDALGALPSGFAALRMLDADYRIDVEGLGAADGSAAFNNVIPESRGLGGGRHV